MISGRCNLSSTIRYASKLSNKWHYYLDRDRSLYLVSGDLPLVAHHLSRYSPVSFLQSARMASTSSNSSKGESSSLGKPLNRLGLEKSPYLLQHATNPVHWYPWSNEAFEKAREEDKIIFLSVGYSTCHWCHVMEKESFENESIAEVMNEHFINIKVDREERPDIDRIYMTFVQTITGHGGWPMSVFLTPDLMPITGGTYFPPTERYGQPGFKTILQEIARKWDSNKADIRSSGCRIIETLKRATECKNKDQELPSEECGRMCAQQLSKGYEIHYGGFSDAPKFPQPVNLNFLLHMYARDPSGQLNQQCLTMCTYTLAKMANGGIHDHIGQGFARYSVDGEWHVPHFEKMLYDQGQLLQSYADAFIVTKEPFFAEVVDDIAKYVIRDLRHREGGFYSAEDADSFPKSDSKKKKEGAFYVWTQEEISSLLDKPIPDSTKTLSDVFCFHYNVKSSGNVQRRQDPHGELTGKNVLIVGEGLENTAEHFGISVETTKNYLKEACQVLFEERLKRPRPHLDDKIVTAWNGLMISGLARAGVATNNKQYIDYATNTAEFIERHLFDKTNNVLLRSCYRNSDDVVIQASVPINGFHVDYAFVVKGLLDLYEANFDERWLEFAESLQDIQDNLFWDAKGGGYFATTTDDPSVILRLKDDHDGAEPSSNSVACGNLLRLAAYLNRNEFRERAGQLLQSFREYLMRVPVAFPELVSACLRYHDTTTQIYIAGKHNDNDTDELIRVVHNRLIPGKIFVLADYDQQDNYIFRKNEVFSKMKPLKGRPTAFVCRHHTCSLPVTSAEHLAALLDEKR